MAVGDVFISGKRSIESNVVIATNKDSVILNPLPEGAFAIHFRIQIIGDDERASTHTIVDEGEHLVVESRRPWRAGSMSGISSDVLIAESDVESYYFSFAILLAGTKDDFLYQLVYNVLVESRK